MISHVKRAPGWALIQVNFDPIQDKVAVGALLKVGTLSGDYSIGHVREGIECNGTQVRIGHRERFRNMIQVWHVDTQPSLNIGLSPVTTNSTSYTGFLLKKFL